MVSFKNKGSFKNTLSFLQSGISRDYTKSLKKYAQIGVDELRKSTPVDTRETASEWYYEIIQNESGFSIFWSNIHINDGVPIALIIQTGHKARDNSWVEGIDYINPAMKPVFDKIASAILKEVNK